MNWLIRQLGSLFDWLWGGIRACSEWILGNLGRSLTWLCNHIQAVAVLAVASIGGVMPQETLAETWSVILQGADWLQLPWCQWLIGQFAVNEGLARITYLGGVYLAAYAVRGLFMGVRALLDLL